MLSAAKFAAYFVIITLLALTEKELGVGGFCVGFLFALLYCREKIYLTLPTFVGGILTVSFSLAAGINAAVGAFVYLLPAIIHLVKNRRYRIWEVALYALLSSVPSFFFADTELFPMLICALGVGIAEVFLYMSIIALYPILVRGLRYGLFGNEKFALGVIVASVCVGLSTFSPLGIDVYIFAVTFATVFINNVDEGGLVFAICAGVGAAVGRGLDIMAYTAIIGLLSYASHKQIRLLNSLVTVAGAALATIFFNGKVDLYFLIPLCCGGLLPLLLSKKFFKKILKNRNIYRERFALRTVVNRDREELAARIKSLSLAFAEMRNILIKERPKAADPESVVKSVCESTCLNCARLNKCLSEMGDLALPVRRLVHTAIDAGKVSILDADVNLGKNCDRLSALLASVNENVKLYKRRQEQLSGIEQGKEMVISDLNGVSVLLDGLAASINVDLSFDPGPERLIMEKLGKANVIAGDVCIFTDGTKEEVNLIVRDCDADKSSIREIVSKIVGVDMKEYYRNNDVNGNVSLRFCPSPNYKVLYGEAVRSDKAFCGDVRKAVKVGRTKLMFILSDGMGTGEDARNTSVQTTRLIETFYMAGYDHKTVFSTVSRLLSLREKEDFSALDVAIIDTQNGELDFIKQGGRESYVFTDDGCEAYLSDSLPLGILESEPTVAHVVLPVDGVVVMLSDGVADALNKSQIMQIVSNIGSSNPQSVADAILADAVRLGSKDDMTVLVLRLVPA